MYSFRRPPALSNVHIGPLRAQIPFDGTRSPGNFRNVRGEGNITQRIPCAFQQLTCGGPSRELTQTKFP